MSEEFTVCGENKVLDADFVGCGQAILEPKQVYRCTDCDVPFHKNCAKKHFETGDVLTEKVAAKQELRWKQRELAARPTPEEGQTK